MTGLVRRRPRRPEPSAFERATYGNVVAALNEHGYRAQVVRTGEVGLGIEIALVSLPRLILADYWGPLPLPQAEQVGWMLAIPGGAVIGARENPGNDAAISLINDAVAQFHLNQTQAFAKGA